MARGQRKVISFYFFRCNPLRMPIPAKQIQGNKSLFIWFYLDIFDLAYALNAVLGIRRSTAAQCDAGSPTGSVGASPVARIAG
jgi:hypothetical protein